MGTSVHIVPDNGQWSTKVSGIRVPLQTHKTQALAIRHGKRVAKSLSTELIIHGRNGRIRERNSYGGDPYPPIG